VRSLDQYVHYRHDGRRVVLPVNRLRAVLVTLAAMAFMAGGAWMCVTAARPNAEESVVLWIIGIAVLVLFGIGALCGVARLINSKPVLVVDNAGVHEHASMTGVGFLAWDEIKVSVVMRQGVQRLLFLDLADPESILTRVSRVRRALLRWNQRRTGMLVIIPTVFLPVPVREVENEINSHLAQRLERSRREGRADV